MRRPNSPRAWICWAIRIRESCHSPRRVLLELGGRRDRRTDDSRETAISVLSLLETAADGAGPQGARLVLDVATGALPWIGLTTREQDTVIRISRRFARALREEDFLAGEGN